MIDTARCPICGKPNHCVMARPGADKDRPCWCRDETFPKGLIDRLPEVVRDKACICRDCVRAYNQSIQQQQ